MQQPHRKKGEEDVDFTYDSNLNFLLGSIDDNNMSRQEDMKLENTGELKKAMAAMENEMVKLNLLNFVKN